MCNDEHSDQEQGDVYAAHHLGVFHQPYPSQDAFIFSAVGQITPFGKPVLMIMCKINKSKKIININQYLSFNFDHQQSLTPGCLSFKQLFIILFRCCDSSKLYHFNVM